MAEPTPAAADDQRAGPLQVARTPLHAADESRPVELVREQAAIRTLEQGDGLSVLLLFHQPFPACFSDSSSWLPIL